MEFNFAFRLYAKLKYFFHSGLTRTALEDIGCRIQLQNLIVWLNIGNTWWLWLYKKVGKQIEENLVVCDHY